MRKCTALRTYTVEKFMLNLIHFIYPKWFIQIQFNTNICVMLEHNTNII